MVQYNWTTCSKVVKAEVNTLQTELQRLLQRNLLGIYLHGSLALGGFNPARSDIDVIVVTRQKMDVETKRRSIELLLRISKMPCPLDVPFLVEQDIFPFQHPLPYDPHCLTKICLCHQFKHPPLQKVMFTSCTSRPVFPPPFETVKSAAC